MTDAVASGDEGQVFAAIMTNESDDSRQNSIQKIAQQLVSLAPSFNKDGGVKFKDTITVHKFGESFMFVYYFYVIGKTDVFMKCRIKNIGSGWKLEKFDINTDFDKIMPSNQP